MMNIEEILDYTTTEIEIKIQYFAARYSRDHDIKKDEIFACKDIN